jgi:hypothetical protein
LQDLGACDEDITVMLQQAPGLLLMSDTAAYIQPRLKLLQQCGFSKQQLLQLIAADPSLLTNSLPALQRKWQYLVEELGLTVDDTLRDCPRYFSKNLLLDVASRHAYATARGLLHRISQVPADVVSTGAAGSASASSWPPCHGTDGSSGSNSDSRQHCLPVAETAETRMAKPGPDSCLPGIATAKQQGSSGDHLSSTQQQQHPFLQQPHLSEAHKLEGCRQQKRHQQRVHLGKMLNCSIPEFVQQLGPSTASADYLQFVNQWAARQGLKWQAVRAALK